MKCTVFPKYLFHCGTDIEKQLGNEIPGAAAETAQTLKRTQCEGQENQKNCRQQETEKVSPNLHLQTTKGI
jgi:hypothetical protein